MTIGEQLRKLRKEHNMTLKTLSDKTNVSISFLSQVERNKCNVTLESLRKISDALNVNPSIFFPNSLQASSQSKFPFFYEDLSKNIKGASFHPILVTLKPKENQGNEFSHLGYEFIYVLTGILTVSIEGTVYELQENDSMMFESSKNHYWWNNTLTDVRFILVSTL
ncbi:helix-turn-helix domain-containing protein [Ureibacillus manganicus]|uniref:DNA-binding protein n=1 Tax=Ureibacillus manganicus DSM 26584 TaxID=1384049 RepID=A0A0A3I911_9BACL|nr:XRE family transcriptional regulator [Ureibacillus manganicus]KGR79985.1 DNA-binding protein [Ureibacillus manganicus DSM 26584]